MNRLHLLPESGPGSSSLPERYLPQASNFRITLLLLAFLLSSCASPQRKPAPSESDTGGNLEQQAQQQMQIDAQAREAQQDKDILSRQQTAVNALLEKAAKARDKENYAVANIHLERALRLQPRSAKVFLELARLRDLQNKPSQAAGFISKGLAVGPNEAEKRSLLELRNKISSGGSAAQTPS